jgi:hypothetical protein
MALQAQVRSSLDSNLAVGIVTGRAIEANCPTNLVCMSVVLMLHLVRVAAVTHLGSQGTHVL